MTETTRRTRTPHASKKTVQQARKKMKMKMKMSSTTSKNFSWVKGRVLEDECTRIIV